MDIFEFSKRVKAFKLKARIEDAILENSPDAIRRNQNQLLDGENALGQPNSPSYARPSYAAFKNKKNPRPGLGTPDIHLTGTLFNKMFMSIEGPKVTIDSSDPKVDFPSIKQYKNKFGLQDQNLASNRKLNNHSLIKFFKQDTGL